MKVDKKFNTDIYSKILNSVQMGFGLSLAKSILLIYLVCSHFPPQPQPPDICPYLTSIKSLTVLLTPLLTFNKQVSVHILDQPVSIQVLDY